ncbi:MULTISPECIES: type II secretion system protein GspD [unclassified Pseudomonas]|uniref:type II secretion system protein GspD n=1 Tax=unclassified Pseudomonas TaxID=196821 RepID=UPI0002A1F346|nr:MULTISPECIES: type II secretion system protein GspD [unclassified Pseudomonas]MBB1610118.1 secretin [Pseudomonas sp. UMC76]MBB1638604.1 secretin [Pseudomonas sp. UME83]NTX90414.1 type II secretion system protein GspD [Pseudomonas sp. UMA643]NTY18516.1 type II secretion system protein GspD [Pseudomonas sp. UMC3103]NTY23304.1 type II secretion system protein GspD [Pseudomonas sp. UMA603]
MPPSNNALAAFPRHPLLLAICLGLLGGCGTTQLQLPAPLLEPRQAMEENMPQEGAEGTVQRPQQSAGPQVSPTPAPPAGPVGGLVDKADRLVLDDKNADLQVNIEDVALPGFINEVFGNLLGLSFEIDDNLKKRNDRVTLRLEQAQTQQTVYDIASQVMANYGVEIVKQGGILRFQVKQIGLSPEEPPILVSGEALPDVPNAYRPVFQFIPLHNVDPKDVIPWLNNAYDKSGLSASADNPRGGLMLKGMASLVKQAAQAVRLLDQPFMRGQHSLRIDPAFITSAEMAKQLKTLLEAQGYSVGIGEASGSVVLVPLESSNGLIVFSNQRSLLDLARDWAGQVDRVPLASAVDSAGAGAESEGLFFYEVRNTRATEVARSLRALVSGPAGSGAYGLTPGLGSSASSRAAAASGNNAVPPRSASGRGGGDMGGGQSGVAPLVRLAGAQALLSGGSSSLMDSLAAGVSGSGTIVEDENRNAILFRGPARVWQQMQPLLRQLDKPARQVLIEVTVASVTLSDNQEAGLEWSLLSGAANSGSKFSREISAGKEGFKYLINTAGGTKATLTALASDKRTRILATPRILVKSGEQANINVGTDIPVVTGRQTDGSNTGGNSNLLQSISYRSTGVILNVSPVVYSNNRVDLTVSQEVSDGGGAGSSGSEGGDISSPPIKRTSLETSLTLQSGGSIFMGGLINENEADSNDGVPWLKNLPVLGYLFGKQTRNTSKDEVVMLIQPYVIDGAEEAREVTEKLRRMIEPALGCEKSLAECRRL